ncbi:acyltransferase family protein [Burkholderia vietnamiensis]|uniref:acyltransferase family protein n=1 Tax=Burkholderia vietnamiensis TaxID=60552 RepID=UPI001AD99680|nr:acyltransferase family protein [Burkholderia vietnamiensis]MDN7413115.1 acyltransferase family protein [Burkholderia vietnamiensis]QTK86418.1 acyltransferase [Burkholderia vietnamiensis]
MNSITVLAAESHSGAQEAASRPAAGYRPDIDVLRALAVSSVILFHAFPRLLRGGFIGVDIFFVISGYLITAHILRDLGESHFSFGAFYGRRIRRIFPALLIVLVGCYLAGWFSLLPEEFKALGKQIAGGAASLSNLLLWTEAGYFDATAIEKPLLHLWSLGVEEQFYLLWPAVLWACVRAKRSPMLLILALGALSFTACVIIVRIDPTAAFYWPLTRAWELMAGSLLACKESREGRRAVGNPEYGVAAGGLLLASSIALMNSHLTLPGWWTIAPTLGTCLVIRNGRDSALLRHACVRPVLTLGLISYPLYLFHWPILSFLRLMSSGTPAWPLRATAVAITVPLAWATYRYVELPIRRTHSPRAVAVTVFILVLGVGYAGLNAYDRDGLEFRMSRLGARFADGVHIDIDHEWRRGACYLEGKGEESFSPECIEAGTAPLVFLWGDSHAAAIYPGLRDKHRDFGVRVAEFSASGCPPLLGGSDRCGRINDTVLAALKRAKPHTLILTANWDTMRLAALGKTVEAARSAGVSRIVLLGQVATWQSGLPKLYWLYWREHHRELPEHSTFALDPRAAAYDDAGDATAKALGIEYVSAYRAMCDADGCLTRVGPGRGKMVEFDDSHLTPAGAGAVTAATAPMLLR